MNEDLIMATIPKYSSAKSSIINGNGIDYTKTVHSSKSNIVLNKYQRYQNMNIFVNKKNLQIVAKVKDTLNTDDELIKLDDFSGQIYNSFITGLFVVGDDKNILRTAKHNSNFLLNDSKNIAIDVIDKKHIIIHQAALSCILIISQKISRLNKILL